MLRRPIEASTEWFADGEKTGRADRRGNNGGGKSLDGVGHSMAGSDAPIAIGIDHGWRPTGEPMVVTQSIDGRVQELDDTPALDSYLQRLGAPREVYDDRLALQS